MSVAAVTVDRCAACTCHPAVKLTEEDVRVEEEPCCQLEPRIVRTRGTCLWDEGLLTLDLLHEIMAAGRATPQEPSLHFGRHIIMRHLWYEWGCDQGRPKVMTGGILGFHGILYVLMDFGTMGGLAIDWKWFWDRFGRILSPNSRI